MTVRLRGHHLLCMLTYAGRGYDDRFVDNFDQVVDRIRRGEEVLVVDGPDDICAPMLASPSPHCRLAHVCGRDATALASVSTALERPVSVGDRLELTPERVRRLRDGFAAGTLRAACLGCEWSGLCSSIAGADFAGTLI